MLIMNIRGMNMDMLMLGILGMVGSVDRCNVRSECFDKCNLMLRMNIWGIYMEMFMLGMLRSFDRCNVRGECGNGGMLWVYVGMLGVNVLIGAMLGMNVEIGEC